MDWDALDRASNLDEERVDAPLLWLRYHRGLSLIQDCNEQTLITHAQQGDRQGDPPARNAIH